MHYEIQFNETSYLILLSDFDLQFLNRFYWLDTKISQFI